MTLALVDIGLNLAHDSFDHDRDAVVAVRNTEAVGKSELTLTSGMLRATAVPVPASEDAWLEIATPVAGFVLLALTLVTGTRAMREAATSRCALCAHTERLL